MTFKEINPYIRFFDVREQQTSYAHELLAYDFRAFGGISGSFTVTVAGQTHRILPDTVLVIPPATPYILTVAAGETNRFCIFNFDMSCASAAQEQSMPPQPVEDFLPARVISREAPPELRAPVFFEADFRVGELLREIEAAFRRRPPLYREECGALLKRILTVGQRSRLDSQSAYPKLIQDVISYVKEHYHTPMTNISIAAAFQYHPNHLNRIFKKHMGEGLHAYIVGYRLKIAKELLRNTDDQIDAIAYATGFATPSHFIKHFKRAFGETPYRFRAELGS